jgi:hypothetical protein
MTRAAPKLPCQWLLYTGLGFVIGFLVSNFLLLETVPHDDKHALPHRDWFGAGKTSAMNEDAPALISVSATLRPQLARSADTFAAATEPARRHAAAILHDVPNAHPHPTSGTPDELRAQGAIHWFTAAPRPTTPRSTSPSRYHPRSLPPTLAAVRDRLAAMHDAHHAGPTIAWRDGGAARAAAVSTSSPPHARTVSHAASLAVAARERRLRHRELKAARKTRESTLTLLANAADRNRLHALRVMWDFGDCGCSGWGIEIVNFVVPLRKYMPDLSIMTSTTHFAFSCLLLFSFLLFHVPVVFCLNWDMCLLFFFSSFFLGWMTSGRNCFCPGFSPATLKTLDGMIDTTEARSGVIAADRFDRNCDLPASQRLRTMWSTRCERLTVTSLATQALLRAAGFSVPTEADVRAAPPGRPLHYPVTIPEIDIWITHKMPSLFQDWRNDYTGIASYSGRPRYVIGRSMTEVDLIDPEWVAKCALVDELWLPSTVLVRAFVAAGVPETKIHIVPEAIDAALFAPHLWFAS